MNLVCWYHNNSANGCKFQKDGCDRQHIYVKQELRSQIPKPKAKPRSQSPKGKGGTGKGKTKAKAKAKAAPAPAPTGRLWCAKFLNGGCKFSEGSCRWPHLDAAVVEEIRRAQRVKAKAAPAPAGGAEQHQ